MAAATSTTAFSTTPTAGLDFGSKSSTPAVDVMTRVNGNDGHDWIYVKASEAIGSITTVIVGAAGSASSDSGSAGWIANVPGGAAAGQYFWAKRTAL